MSSPQEVIILALAGELPGQQDGATATVERYTEEVIRLELAFSPGAPRAVAYFGIGAARRLIDAIALAAGLVPIYYKPRDGDRGPLLPPRAAAAPLPPAPLIRELRDRVSDLELRVAQIQARGDACADCRWLVGGAMVDGSLVSRPGVRLCIQCYEVEAARQRGRGGR